jgi:CDP-L-myo-inositol myo-inositolphosphotransferase
MEYRYSSWRSRDENDGRKDSQMSTHIRQAVILAAGKGTRIRKGGQILPKPLVRVGGLTLLKRAILTGQREGVNRFVIVVGCDGDQVKQATMADPDLEGVELVWVQNDDYELSNGVSVLKAQPHITGEFFLLMADHIVDRKIYRVLQAEPARRGLVLAVDRKLNTIFDMDDATKVQVRDGERIGEIGKEIPEFDAVDTGVFRCSPALFDALDSQYAAHGDASLSDGVRHLARGGQARVADVGDAWWQDVDTPETIGHATKLLFGSLTKSIDGPVSRHINRRFSKAVTRALMNTSVTPNHMTAVGLIIGLASAVVTAFATSTSLWLIGLGGILYQLSSMIDGCDGELARLKFKHSDMGEWFDTISDDVINLSYQLALGYALFQITGVYAWLELGIATFVLGWGLCFFLYRRLLSSGKGTHLALDFGLKEPNMSFFARFVARFEAIGHRDCYALILMVLALIGPTAIKVGLVLSFAVVAITSTQWALTSLRPQPRRRPRDTASIRALR